MAFNGDHAGPLVVLPPGGGLADLLGHLSVGISASDADRAAAVDAFRKLFDDHPEILGRLVSADSPAPPFLGRLSPARDNSILSITRLPESALIVANCLPDVVLVELMALVREASAQEALQAGANLQNMVIMMLQISENKQLADGTRLQAVDLSLAFAEATVAVAARLFAPRLFTVLHDILIDVDDAGSPSDQVARNFELASCYLCRLAISFGGNVIVEGCVKEEVTCFDEILAIILLGLENSHFSVRFASASHICHLVSVLGPQLLVHYHVKLFHALADSWVQKSKNMTQKEELSPTNAVTAGSQGEGNSSTIDSSSSLPANTNIAAEGNRSARTSSNGSSSSLPANSNNAAGIAFLKAFADGAVTTTSSINLFVATSQTLWPHMTFYRVVLGFVLFCSVPLTLVTTGFAHFAEHCEKLHGTVRNLAYVELLYTVCLGSGMITLRNVKPWVAAVVTGVFIFLFSVAWLLLFDHLKSIKIPRKWYHQLVTAIGSPICKAELQPLPVSRPAPDVVIDSHLATSSLELSAAAVQHNLIINAPHSEPPPVNNDGAKSDDPKNDDAFIAFIKAVSDGAITTTAVLNLYVATNTNIWEKKDEDKDKDEFLPWKIGLQAALVMAVPSSLLIAGMAHLAEHHPGSYNFVATLVLLELSYTICFSGGIIALSHISSFWAAIFTLLALISLWTLWSFIFQYPRWIKIPQKWHHHNGEGIRKVRPVNSFS